MIIRITDKSAGPELGRTFSAEECSEGYIVNWPILGHEYIIPKECAEVISNKTYWEYIND